MRIMEGRKSEKVTPRYKNYFDAATKKWYLSGLDIANPNKPITRWELGLLLYVVAKPAPVVVPVVPEVIAPVSTGNVLTWTQSVWTGIIATGNITTWSIFSSGSLISGAIYTGDGISSWAEFSSELIQ
jgi:hypothetical protein